MANEKQKSIIKLGPHPKLVKQLQSQILKYGGLKIVGFGIFKLKRMKPRIGFDPNKKQRVKFPAYTKITFTPTKTLKDKIQIWK